MGVETKEIPFYDDTLLGVKDEDGKVWLLEKLVWILGCQMNRLKDKLEILGIPNSLNPSGANSPQFKMRAEDR